MSYRESHLAKGADYDATIQNSPFDAYMARWEAIHLTRLVEDLFDGRVGRYLDFACGTGRILQTVAPLAEKSYGVDISASMAEQARGKSPTTEFLIGDFTTTPLEIGSVDLVTSFRFIGNAEQELRLQALAAINRVLKPGGYFVCNNHRNPYALPVLMHRLSGGGTEGLDLSHRKATALLHDTGFTLRATRCIGLWAFRHGLCTRERLESRSAELLERLVRLPGQAHVCPDVILIAEKTADV